MRTLFAISFVMSFATVSFAQATFVNDGNQLMRDCDADVRLMDNNGEANGDSALLYHANGCASFLDGVLGTHSYMAGNKPLFCPDPAITTGQFARTVAKYLHDHPERLHIDASTLAIAALKLAFPCQRKVR